MDDRDTDFYTFTATRTGTQDLEIENRSPTFIPGLSVFAPDRRFTGFGPDVRTPGTPLKHAFPIDEGQTYYLQVWSQANTAGAYRMTLK